jgi:hypothetical protein
MGAAGSRLCLFARLLVLLHNLLVYLFAGLFVCWLVGLVLVQVPNQLMHVTAARRLRNVQGHAHEVDPERSPQPLPVVGPKLARVPNMPGRSRSSTVRQVKVKHYQAGQGQALSGRSKLKQQHTSEWWPGLAASSTRYRIVGVDRTGGKGRRCLRSDTAVATPPWRHMHSRQSPPTTRATGMERHVRTT